MRTLLLLVFLLPTQLYAEVIGEWRFNNNNQTTTYSLINDLHGATTNVQYSTDLPYEIEPDHSINYRSIQLIGDDSYVTFNTATITETIYFELWVKPQPPIQTNVSLLSRQYDLSGTQSFDFGLLGGNSGIYFSVTNDSGVTKYLSGGYSLGSDSWWKVTGVYDMCSVDLFLNDTLALSEPFSGPLGYVNSNPIILGGSLSGSTYSNYYSGFADGLIITDAIEAGRATCHMPEPSSYILMAFVVLYIIIGSDGMRRAIRSKFSSLL